MKNYLAVPALAGLCYIFLVLGVAIGQGCERCDRVNQEEGKRLLSLYGDTQSPTPLATDHTNTGAANVEMEEEPPPPPAPRTLSAEEIKAEEDKMRAEAKKYTAETEKREAAWQAGADKADEPQNYEDNDDHSLTGDEEAPKAEEKAVEKSAPTPKLKDLLVSIAVRPMVGAYVEQLVRELRRTASVCDSGEAADVVACTSIEKLALTYGWFAARSVWFRDVADHTQIRKHLSERVGPDTVSEQQYNVWRKAVMEQMRKYLSKPANVKVQYKQFKAQALATLKQELTTQQLEQVKTLLASYAKQYFAEYEKIPQDLQNAAGSEEKSYELLNQGPSCTEEEADQLSVVRNSAAALLKGRVSSPETFHFARRRHAEGGQKLLDVYAWCLKDLAAAIK